MINLSVNSTNPSYQYASASIHSLCELVLKDTNYKSISLNIIFCDDKSLLENKIIFDEDVLTDMISIPYSKRYNIRSRNLY